MKKQDEEASFLCSECQRYFDLRLLHSRDKKKYCPTCYVDHYDSWECAELDSFETDKESDSLASGQG